jgi:hypothetical protein
MANRQQIQDPQPKGRKPVQTTLDEQGEVADDAQLADQPEDTGAGVQPNPGRDEQLVASAEELGEDEDQDEEAEEDDELDDDAEDDTTSPA